MANVLKATTATDLVNVQKLGPGDNRPSTNKHKHIVQKNIYKLWHLTPDTVHMTRDMWHMTSNTYMWHMVGRLYQDKIKVTQKKNMAQGSFIP